jgi:hypothetical protein
MHGELDLSTNIQGIVPWYIERVARFDLGRIQESWEYGVDFTVIQFPKSLNSLV